ncbi:MAG TPA: molybdopterin-dependent oxidoreductase [Thermodesulfobacteriota bacterium]|nr:molybdopterin-dependent oxidoreductase [Thermodesulfobacteriota bacterium]
MAEIDRRGFLKVLGVGGAAAGVTTLAGCGRPQTPLYSAVQAETPVPPGLPVTYATTCRECPAGCGLLVQVREGRAIKVEGNPAHPVNRGKTCALGQASLQGLYNPDRIRQPQVRDAQGGWRAVSWDEGLRLLVGRLAELRRRGEGRRVVFLTGELTGSLDALIDRWLERAAGGGRRVVWAPLAPRALAAASRLAFGVEEVPYFDLARARYLVSFGADFLETWLSPTHYAAAFAAMHAFSGSDRPGVFVHVEARRSMTGSNADEWLAPRPGTEGLVALAMAHVIVREGLGRPPAGLADRLRQGLARFTPEAVARQADVPAATIERLARDFARARPSLAVGGGAAVQGANATATLVAIHLLNAVAGNVGETVRFGRGYRTGRAAGLPDLAQLTRAMAAGEVGLLLVHEANPLHDAPGGLKLAEALDKVPFTVSFASWFDETAARAHLILPDHTFLESWGDAVPQEGVHALLQPVMTPLFDTRATGDVLLASARALGADVAAAFPWESFEAYLKAEWQRLKERLAPAGSDFDAWWRQALGRGGVFVEPPARRVELQPQAIEIAATLAPPRLEGEGEFTLVVYPSPNLRDGRGANRPWLQELPDPVTKVVWGSWVEMHPDTAARLGIRIAQELSIDRPRGWLLPAPMLLRANTSDVVALETPQGRIEAPVYVYPFIRPDVVAVQLGQGHTEYGRYARGRGANPARLLPAVADGPSGAVAWLATRVRVVKTGERRPLVTTAGADDQRGRNLYRALPVADALAGKRVAHPHEARRPATLPPVAPEVPYHWGMAIDLDRCIGCQACVVACYAENNIPVVGETQVARGREMAWIRVERYWEPDGSTTFAPMLCVHCANAPCEPVCPVFATYHNPEGLNTQIYNRCVGTRYCQNNCPYKVRFFNWFDYSREAYAGKPNPAYAWPYPLNLQLNPDVTVRSVGVMEKCTMCIQRINRAKDRATDEGRLVRDGEFTTACAQACPTEAIVFGNLKDPDSRVAKLQASPRSYAVLEELGTHPSTTHLAKVTLAAQAADRPAAGGGEARQPAH